MEREEIKGEGEEEKKEGTRGKEGKVRECRGWSEGKSNFTLKIISVTLGFFNPA